jgi:hypothetical protein
VVIFLNDLPPLDSLSKDRWKVYKIEYDNEGASELKYMSLQECADEAKKNFKRKKVDKIQ